MRSLGCILLISLAIACAAASQVGLTLDSSEADAALVILQKEASGTTPNEANWQRLFDSEPYRRLKLREASAGAAFNDDAFRQFLESPAMIADAPQLQRTLQAWKQADLKPLATRDLTYLPAGARIQAKVYPEIKPAANSFVWGDGADKAIFLYLNPALTRAQFENKVAHECHHIGLDSLESQQERLLAGLSEEQKRAVRWLGGFGEGEAILAAAGSPHVHPHAADDQAARDRWDRDMANFNQDLVTLQRFYLRILDGELNTPAAIAQAAEPFYGTQGPFYTVGYRMASLVEIHFGRRALTGAMLDPRKLLVLYNRAAVEENRGHGSNLGLWPNAFLHRLSPN